MGGIYVPWLADAARLTGCPVVELAGWRTRGHGGMAAVEGVVCHHTAGPKTGEYPSLAVVRDGRAGLAGPLANFGLGRSGTVYVNAAGLAWHAGVSSWAGFSDLNSRFLGIEAEDDGDGVWTDAQLDAYPRLVAALLYYMRRGAERACMHRECAPGRKIDAAGIDAPALRARVAQMLTDPLRLIPRGGPTSAPAGSSALPRGEEMRIDLTFYDDAWKPDPAGLNFRGVTSVELADTSAVIDGCWLRWAWRWGAVTGFKTVAWAAGNVILGEPTPDQYRGDYWPIPGRAREITVEGRREHPGVAVSCRLIEKAK